MVEVQEEATYVRHHKKKIAFLFSAMRHFADELRGLGWKVDYVTLDAGEISRREFEQLAVAINTGTNLPSVATPNGQAAFLFLLTSALAPLIRLSYGRMVIMALPYTLVMGGVGLTCVVMFV